uniref:Proteasome activator PA28 C-terminal domain-containing protein n=1 Tax=Ditylenchus dipsaci TaxID=166011 RepID=A0A915DLM4_9BILA
MMFSLIGSAIVYLLIVAIFSTIIYTGRNLSDEKLALSAVMGIGLMLHNLEKPVPPPPSPPLCHPCPAFPPIPPINLILPESLSKNNKSVSEVKVRREASPGANAKPLMMFCLSLPKFLSISKFLSNPCPYHMKLLEMVDLVRPLLREAIEDVNKDKVWIQFLIPRIEHGNNFGVSIQVTTFHAASSFYVLFGFLEKIFESSANS